MEDLNNFQQGGDLDLYYGLESFTDGKSSHAYRYLGAHPAERSGQEGWLFRTWAPNAENVCVMGDFNGWDKNADPMERLEGGLWEKFVPSLQEGMLYKFAVHGKDGKIVDKADPYAFYAEVRPKTASILYELKHFTWTDENWLSFRKGLDTYHAPMNIYEVHLGSWRRTGEGEFLSYRDTADYLASYVKEMGYTHVELMPVTEYPYDMSWGYQATGYFAPTSRYGRPEDFQYLVNKLHEAGVGVILDWVPAHFPRDAFGLYHFDGTPTYEYEDVLKGEQNEWGTQVFDFGRNEVRSFLKSSAMFWLEEYHIDGIRVDAVASMLYLDYARRDGEWTPNIYGGHENLEAIEFLRDMNQTIHREHPDVLTIAEESTAWEYVTGDHLRDSRKALAFTYKWNMGWMNDILHYQKLDPYFRQFNQKDITFSLMYAFNEHYILPISHDEVVHMKGSLVWKMPGEIEMKYAGVRAFMVYMMTQPGKKLIMMGTEFGQINEWHYEYSLDWHLLREEPHRKMQRFFRELNVLYLRSPEFWSQDDSWEGFEWVCPNDTGANTISYYRTARGGHKLLVLVNFSPNCRKAYRVGLDETGIYRILFSSDSPDYGGKGTTTRKPIASESVPCHGREQSLVLDIPPLTGLILQREKPLPKKPVKHKGKKVI